VLLLLKVLLDFAVLPILRSVRLAAPAQLVLVAEVVTGGEGCAGGDTGCGVPRAGGVIDPCCQEEGATPSRDCA
jgi:hypothetical protein